jgi:hypothetical protein
MSWYLIRWENALYANDELFIEAIAGGERAFMKMLAGRKATGRKLFDQTLYPLTAEQADACRAVTPMVQDFDNAYKCLNIISRDTINQVKAHMDAGYPNSTVITISENYIPPLYKYRQITFFKVSDYKAQRKYAMVPKMAAVKVCGRLYVALNAVNIYAEAPIIVTIDR